VRLQRSLVTTLAGLAALVAAASSFAFLAGRGPGPDGVSGAVWIANEGAGSLSVLDAATNDVVATVTGVAAPHNVQAGDGLSLWVTSGRGTLLRLETHYDLHQERRVGRHPAHVIELPDGDVWVTDEAGDAVTVFGGGARATLPAGDGPHGLRASRDGRHVLVANRGSDSVSLYDAATRRALAEIPVGREPVQVAFAPDGATAYVTLRGENAVAAVDLSRHEVVDRVAVGRGPVQLYPTPDGRRLVVANQGTAARPGRTVSLVGTSPFRELAKIAAGAGPHGVVVDPSGRRAYVTNTYAGTVSVLDLERRRELAEIPTGRGPNGITFSPVQPLRAHRPIPLGLEGGHGH
jgi:YVTN family beta-propeller protein